MEIAVSPAELERVLCDSEDIGDLDVEAEQGVHGFDLQRLRTETRARASTQAMH